MSKEMREQINKIKNFGEFLTENRFENRDGEKYRNCLMSDLSRMEIIELFFKKVETNNKYNITLPIYNKLIDDYDGYDDQVYIQNKLNDDEIVFWEGWVNSCWGGVKVKSEYDGLNKEEVIEKIITDRFGRIASEFNYKVQQYEYFKHKGKYIMKIVFRKEM